VATRGEDEVAIGPAAVRCDAVLYARDRARDRGVDPNVGVVRADDVDRDAPSVGREAQVPEGSARLPWVLPTGNDFGDPATSNARRATPRFALMPEQDATVLAAWKARKG